MHLGFKRGRITARKGITLVTIVRAQSLLRGGIFTERNLTLWLVPFQRAVASRARIASL